MFSGLSRLEAELVDASAPHLELAPPSVHVIWWVGFLILLLMVIEKPKNRIKITRVMQLKYGPPQKSSNMTLLRENSLNAVSLGRQIVLPTGVPRLPIEQANKQ